MFIIYRPRDDCSFYLYECKIQLYSIRLRNLPNGNDNSIGSKIMSKMYAKNEKKKK